MTIRDLVGDYVLADGTVQNFIATRLYPKQLPAKVTFPAAVIQSIDIVRPNTLRGVATLAKARIQIDVYCNGNGAAAMQLSSSTAAVDLVGAAIRRRLDGFSGTFDDTSTSPATPVRAWVTFDLETETDEADLHGGLSRHTADYFVEYNTAAGVY